MSKDLSNVVECKVCGKKLKSLVLHLRTHNMTTKEYLGLYPSAKLKSEELLARERTVLEERNKSGKMRNITIQRNKSKEMREAVIRKNKDPNQIEKCRLGMKSSKKFYESRLKLVDNLVKHNHQYYLDNPQKLKERIDNWREGYYEVHTYNGVDYRSWIECELAKKFEEDDNIMHFEYESIVLEASDTELYLLDFKLVLDDDRIVYVEVKSRPSQMDNCKLHRCFEYSKINAIPLTMYYYHAKNYTTILDYL